MTLDFKEEKVGFFPLSYNLAEMGRAILVAKEYEALGGKTVFFSHGGRYEELAEKQGFDVKRVEPFYDKETVEKIISVNRGERKGVPYDKNFLKKAVQEETRAFKETDVKMVVSFVNFTCSLSTRVAGLKHVDVSPGPGTFYLSMPDYYENFFTRFLPQKIKVRMLNWFFYKSGKKILKPFNDVAEENQTEKFKDLFDLIHGDITLVTNFSEFIDVFPNQKKFPDDNYVGVILLEKLFKKSFSKSMKQEIEKKIKKHLDSENKKILLTMGSSGDRKLYGQILRTLNETSYQTVALYGDIFDEDDLPTTGDNILLEKYVPSIKEVHKMVDLSITHGGQGTVYAAAYAGKPIIGFPMQFEQHLNLEKIVGHGSGLMLSKKFFKEEKLKKTIKKIFDNYDYFLKNAEKLAEKLPEPNGERNAALKIKKILQDQLKQNV